MGLKQDLLRQAEDEFVGLKAAVAGLGAVLRDLEASHRDFLTAAQKVPDERFAPDKTATRILDMNGPHHYREHAAEIRAWRARERV
jgi:hypothetical protein